MSRQFQGTFRVVYRGPVTVDVANAATGSGTSGVGTATVAGVAVGDLVFVSPRAAFTAGAPVLGDVSAANTVRLTTMNNSAGAVDQASQVYDITVLRMVN